MITAYKIDGTDSAILAEASDLSLLGDGWTLNQAECAPQPLPPPPTRVTRWQILKELNAATPRITFSEIEAILPQVITDPTALEDAYIDLENAQTFERAHPLFPVVAARLGVDDAWIDERFRNAAKR
jgi:hypothetical protein